MAENNYGFFYTEEENLKFSFTAGVRRGICETDPSLQKYVVGTRKNEGSGINSF